MTAEPGSPTVKERCSECEDLDTQGDHASAAHREQLHARIADLEARLKSASRFAAAGRARIYGGPR